MTCDERRDLFLMNAAGALPPEEAESLRAHLASGCPACAGADAEARAVVAQLPTALPLSSPNSSLLDQLMCRVQRDNESTSMSISPASQRARGRAGWWISVVAAACFGAAVAGAVIWSLLGDSRRIVGAPNLRYVALDSSTQPHAHGRIFWDAQRNDWHVYVFDLQPPPPGKTYELWFIGSNGRKVPAGTFDVDARGSARLVSHVPSDIGPLAAAAVTDEAAGGVPQPAGQIQLLGKIP